MRTPTAFGVVKQFSQRGVVTEDAEVRPFFRKGRVFSRALLNFASQRGRGRFDVYHFRKLKREAGVYVERNAPASLFFDNLF